MTDMEAMLEEVDFNLPQKVVCGEWAVVVKDLQDDKRAVCLDAGFHLCR